MGRLRCQRIFGPFWSQKLPTLLTREYIENSSLSIELREAGRAKALKQLWQLSGQRLQRGYGATPPPYHRAGKQAGGR